MNDVVPVQEGESEGDVVADVELHAVGQRLLRLLQKVSERGVHQLHQQNGRARVSILRYAQILHYVGMSDLAEQATLLLEPCPVPGVVGVHQDGVEEFGRTGQLVERGLTHLSVCSRAEGSISHETDRSEAKGNFAFLRHVRILRSVLEWKNPFQTRALFAVGLLPCRTTPPPKWELEDHRNEVTSEASPTTQ